MRYLKFESDKYGLNDRLSELEYTITNESNWDVDVVNKKSKGISQFLLSTWLGSCSNKDDREDAYKSIECMTMMWSKGLDYQWDAYCLHYWDEDCINKRNIYPIK